LGNWLGDNRARDGRISFLEILEERRQHAESCSILAADSEGAFFASAISFDLVLCVLQFLKDLFTPLQEHLAGGRQFHVSPASHEELGAELVLQSLDALAQRRLRNVQQRRSPPKMQGLCDRSKIPEPDQIHV
jgi:hypothetical protein